MSVRQRHRGNSRRILVGLGIAVLCHLAALPILPLLIPEAPEIVEKKRAVKLVNLSPQLQKRLRDQRRKNKAAQSPEKEKKEEKKKDEEKIDIREIEGQIVELAPSADDTPPEEADFLSEHNTRTERETISRNRSADHPNVMNEVTRGKGADEETRAMQQAKAMVLGESTKPQSEPAEAVDSTGFALPKLKFQQELKLDKSDSGYLNNERASQELPGRGDVFSLNLQKPTEQSSKPASGAPQIGTDSLKLVPSVGVLASLSGAPMSDHIENMEEGEGTFLNSREFKYASYFNRMKRGVSQHWQPMLEYRRRDPSGNIYGKRSRLTVVNITLKADGRVKDLSVSRSSGVEFLDHEALLAVRRAQPFPNPPRGLINDQTGLIEFPFSFHIEFSRRGLGLPF